MKKFNRLQRILISAILFVIVFGCIMLGLRQNTMTNPGYSAWTYIKYGLIDYPVTSLGNAVSDVSNLWHVYDDNVYLNEQLAIQRSYQTMYQDEKNKNQELQEMLDMQDSLGDAVRINCTVLERPTQNWNQIFTISAGKNEGIQENMLVSTSQGVVGLIESVQTATSTVRLLTSPKLHNDIAIEIPLDDGTTIEGVLQSYDTSKRAYVVHLFDHDATVTNGAQVATSGKGGNYPSGIFIGTVTDTVMNDDAIISTVYVRPVTNMQSFNYVTVIGNKKS
ncbi:rod shape-determining protein MreC [Firmicutes bacterium M10-2]|nr:rod shape-determining protein MreC [Firmicutes bacterium M10-2]